jgi:hypothetical protein
MRPSPHRLAAFMFCATQTLGGQEAGQSCVTRSVPAKLPAVSAVVDSALLAQFIVEDSLPTAEFFFAVTVDSTGQLRRFHPVPGVTEPTARFARTVGGAIVTETPGKGWAGRVRVRTGSPPSVTLQASEYCAALEQKMANRSHVISDELQRLLDAERIVPVQTNIIGGQRKDFDGTRLVPGRVLVQVAVSERGNVIGISLITKGPNASHDSLAVRLARQLVYFPAVYDKRPVISADSVELRVANSGMNCPCAWFTSQRKP